jgi:predicted molibdopterin-dependent oxidoreductase YjgC
MSDELINIVIDGQAAEARPGETLLQVCRRLGKEIPTLCHHEVLKPYASCRVCLVEVTGQGRTGLVPSCQYPVSAGLVVETASPAVVAARRLVLEMLLARCPKSEALRALAAHYGVTSTPFPSDDPEETCILCGLCVRMCEEVMGEAAIGFAQRGIERRVGPPFEEASEACIGCGACVNVCPTGHVRAVYEEAMLRLPTWGTDLPLAVCTDCGTAFAPQRLVDRLRAKAEELQIDLRLCPRCRVRNAGRKVAQAARVGTAPAGSGGKP